MTFTYQTFTAANTRRLCTVSILSYLGVLAVFLLIFGVFNLILGCANTQLTHQPQVTPKVEVTQPELKVVPGVSHSEFYDPRLPATLEHPDKLLPTDPDTRITMRIREHPGSKMVDHDDITETIEAVLNFLPNTRTDPQLIKLIYETMIVETNLGAASYRQAAKRRNFGIGQITPTTAKHIINTLKKKDKNTYKKLQSLYNPGKSFNENLLTNVPYSIGLMSQLYLQRVPDLLKHTKSLRSRAKIWKKVYNTSAGAGTVEGYANKAKHFYTKYGIPERLS